MIPESHDSRSARTTPRLRVLAIASGGGHWVQLLRLRPAFENCEVTYASVRREYAGDLDEHDASRFIVVPDATRWDRWGLLRMALRVAWLVIVRRPDVVVSTGAAPGYVAIAIGRRFGARTLWLDSIANVEQLSLSGERAIRHADLVLTQWPHLAREGQVEYRGSVL